MNSGDHLVQNVAAPWVAEAVSRPIAFSQVREDAVLDQSVVGNLAAGAEILMIASGGCSAAALATMPQVTRMHIIDSNPAQIALCRLKLRLLATTGFTERLSILGHAFMPIAERRHRLAAELNSLNLPAEALGPIDLVATEGPDHSGRYEVLFAKLREALSDKKNELTNLLQLRDPGEQSRRADPLTELGQALDAAFDYAMALPNLVGLFGEAATRNPCEPFSRHFAGRTRHALATLPAADNPYLWQLLLGRFPNKQVYPWLSAPVCARMPQITWAVTSMADSLDGESYDFIHLSNILDWLSPDEAQNILERVWKALRPGGCTLIRQLNSSLDIPALGGQLEWDLQAARSLHDRDRSFFYRSLHVGRKA